MNFTIGTDFEGFLHRREGNTNIYVGALEVLPYTKDNPLRVNGFAYHADNVTIEAATPPADHLEQWLLNIRHAKCFVEDIAKEHGLKVSYHATAYYTRGVLSEPYYRKFGCDPEYNIFLDETMVPPDPPVSARFAGGHIHVGSDKLRTKEGIQDFVEYVSRDLHMLGRYGNYRERYRRRHYGAVGACRIKPYGVEWRSLSSFWLNSPDYWRMVYESVERFHNA